MEKSKSPWVILVDQLAWLQTIPSDVRLILSLAGHRKTNVAAAKARVKGGNGTGPKGLDSKANVSRPNR